MRGQPSKATTDAPALPTQPTGQVTTPAALEWYAIYCGDINLANLHRLTAGLTVAMQMNVTRLHLLFHTWGGIAGDGVYLYNLLRQIPLDVVLYNGGQVASAGAVGYLGARTRKTTANAIFMIHRTHNSPQFANAARLRNISDSLVLDDERTEAIFREHLELPPDLWTQLENHDVYLSGTEAVTYGLADEVAEFAPPPGTKVMNALG